MSYDDKNQELLVAYDELEPFDTATPEKGLLTAILVNALSDVRKGGELERKATEFFLSPEDDYVFSFLSICDYLRLDPKKLLVVAGLDKNHPIKQDNETDDTQKP